MSSVPPSVPVKAIAENLTTIMGFPWRYGGAFSKSITGRQGRIYAPFVGTPGGVEQWQYEVFLNFKTKLQATDADDLAVLGLDFMPTLHRAIKTATESLRLRIDPINGDRHGALSESHRDNADYITGEIVIIETSHLYKISHHEPLINL